MMQEINLNVLVKGMRCCTEQQAAGGQASGWAGADLDKYKIIYIHLSHFPDICPANDTYMKYKCPVNQEHTKHICVQII